MRAIRNKVMEAIKENDENGIQVLLSATDDPDFGAKDGEWSPLMVAIDNKNEALANMLAEAGASGTFRNPNGGAAGVVAITRDISSTARILADKTEDDCEMRRDCIFMAKKNGMTNIESLLEKGSAKPYRRNRTNKRRRGFGD